MIKATKRLGICMDHASTHLIEFRTDPFETTVDSKFIHEVKEQSLGKSE